MLLTNKRINLPYIIIESGTRIGAGFEDPFPIFYNRVDRPSASELR